MRFYTQQHRFYAGGDLHARTLYLHVLDADGRTCFDRNLPARPDSFLEAIQPFRDGLVVGVERMFAWYWVADLCQREQIAFVLGHALKERDCQSREGDLAAQSNSGTRLRNRHHGCETPNVSQGFGVGYTTKPVALNHRKLPNGRARAAGQGVLLLDS